MRTWNGLENAHNIFHGVTWGKCSIKPTEAIVYLFPKRVSAPKTFSLYLSGGRPKQRKKNMKATAKKNVSTSTSIKLGENLSNGKLLVFRTFNTIFPDKSHKKKKNMGKSAHLIGVPSLTLLCFSIAFVCPTKVQVYPCWKYLNMSISVDYAAYQRGI